MYEFALFVPCSVVLKSVPVCFCAAQIVLNVVLTECL